MTMPAEIQHPIATAGKAARQTFRSLRVRNYRLWFVGQLVSLCGTWMQVVAQAWLVYQLTHSAIDLGVTSALQFAPMLLFGVYGGLVADRFNKRTVLMLTQTAFMLQALALGLLVSAGAATVQLVWVMAVVTGLINCIDVPSRQSFAIEMVGRDDLMNAISLNSVMQNGSRIVGPAIGGVIIASFGVSWAFLSNSATFLAVLTSLLLMRALELHRSRPVPREKGQIRAGLKYAWTTWELRIPLILLAVVSTLAYNFQVVLPLLGGDVFHTGVGTYGAMYTAMGIGALAGGLVTAARRRTGYTWLLLVTAAFGAFSVGVAFAPTVSWALALLVLLGGAGIGFTVSTNSLLQFHAKDGMRGRIMALWAIVFLGSTPIGAPITGFLAADLGPRWALAIGGMATLLAAAACAPALRRLHTAGGQAGDRRREPAADAAVDAAPDRLGQGTIPADTSASAPAAAR